MIFKNRQEAGQKLAVKLMDLACEGPLVLAVPRGGVEVAFPVAVALHAPLDVFIARKLGAPGNPELAIGAMAEEGELILAEELVASLKVSPDYLAQAVEQARLEIGERLKRYRGGRPALIPSGRTIILVDDGVATGSTLQAALLALRSKGAGRIVLAVPVAAHEAAARLRPLADELRLLQEPSLFLAIGQFYEDFSQISEDRVSILIQQAAEIWKKGKEINAETHTDL